MRKVRMRWRGEKWCRWLPLPRKVPVKSKGQRHILSGGVFLSAFPYGDFCKPYRTRKQWLFASDCVNREKVRQPCGKTLCLWGALGIFSRGPIRRTLPAILPSLTKNERGPFVLVSREKYYLEKNFNFRNYDQSFDCAFFTPVKNITKLSNSRTNILLLQTFLLYITAVEFNFKLFVIKTLSPWTLHFPLFQDLPMGANNKMWRQRYASNARSLSPFHSHT